MMGPAEPLPTQPKTDRTWLALGGALALFWAVFLIFFNQGDGPGGMPPPELNPPRLSAPVDFDWGLSTLDGVSTPFSAYRGRPVVLNFWATWCPPCRAEMPSLVALASDPKLKEVAFVCVTDEAATPAVRAYVAESMRGLTVLRADGVPPAFATDGIPATFILDASGKVVAAHQGAARWDDPSVVAFLEGLLKAGPKSGEATPSS